MGGERINYFCPSENPDEQVVILGEPQPGTVWTASWAALTGQMPDLTVVDSADKPIRRLWK